MFSGLCWKWIDEDAISCSVGEDFLIGKHFLQDDEDSIYPIENVQKIRFELVDSIENVIEKYRCGNIRYVWYSKDMIKIYSDES